MIHQPIDHPLLHSSPTRRSSDLLRKVIATRIAPRLRARLLKEAVEQISKHRAAGHRTVLITGQIDVFVEPLRSEAHTSELQSRGHLVCRLQLAKKKLKNADKTVN